jgi:hypothetical protein
MTERPQIQLKPAQPPTTGVRLVRSPVSLASGPLCMLSHSALGQFLVEKHALWWGIHTPAFLADELLLLRR